MAAAVTAGAEIVVGHVRAEVDGRYLLRPAAPGAGLLAGFHGYGQDAEAMLRALLEIPAARAWNVAAVQALHPFYDRRNGKVVASWMTKLDREQAIADNVAYVEGTLAALTERAEAGERRVYAGFSQGTAMAYRAAAAAGERCHGVVALAGDVPPELAGSKSWGRPPVLIGRGTEDALYEEARWERDEALLVGLGSTVETCVYEGGHEWTGTFRRAAAAFLEKLSD